MIRLLFLGDIVGNPGRRAASELVPRIRDAEKVDLVIANSENSAGGVGITPPILKELLRSRIDVLTSGNHAWDKKEGHQLYNDEPRQIRPANYPSTSYFPTPGSGSYIAETKSGVKVAVLNIMGRVFMQNYDCPFQCVDELLKKVSAEAKIIFVDFHAETTSEKKAMGFFLNGRVSAVVGTHTHVQTSDEQILSEGTAFLTDAGMTGPHDSVIGMGKEKVLERFLTARHARYEVAKNDIRLQGAIIDIDEATGKALKIKRVNEKL